MEHPTNHLNKSITNGKRNLHILIIVTIAFFVSITFGVLVFSTAFYIRKNVVQAFKIPSNAMEPTLIKGDLILVDKAIYKNSNPNRGDIIVFIYPQDRKKIYAKRLVGLPGETIEIRYSSVFIDGTPVKDGVIGRTHYYNKGIYAKDGQQIKIPDDGYFVLGDNSISSLDSRYWGFVPKKNIVGKAYKIYYPFAHSGPIK